MSWVVLSLVVSWLMEAWLPEKYVASNFQPFYHSLHKTLDLQSRKKKQFQALKQYLLKWQRARDIPKIVILPSSYHLTDLNMEN